MTEPNLRPMPRRGLWMRRARLWHRHLGLFFAPAILFFSVTGGLQTLGLHEARQGQVPAWLANAASLHKHQRLGKPKAATIPAPTKVANDPTPAPRVHVALRWFVVLMAIALSGSAITGCVIALQLRATRRQAAIALVAGIVVPLILYAL